MNIKGSTGRKTPFSHQGKRLLFMALPFMILAFAFSYVPLFGWTYAFFNYKIGRPLFESQFVGFKNFAVILKNPAEFLKIMRNTLALSGYNLILSPLPAIFAIFLNELDGKRARRGIQTLTTLPNFISWIITYSLVFAIFSTDGMLNNLFKLLGGNGNSYNPLSDKYHVWLVQAILSLWKSLMRSRLRMR